jgi:hypothetical protein
LISGRRISNGYVRDLQDEGSIERAADRTFLLMLPGIFNVYMRAGLARVGAGGTRADRGLGRTLSPTGNAWARL